MTFEFLIACREKPGGDIPGVLRDVLTLALLDNLNEFEDEMIDQMIIPRQSRLGDEQAESAGDAFRHVVLAFTLELPDGTTEPRAIVDQFASDLLDTDSIIQVVKFEDPLLLADLACWAQEIFFLEMKLRRVLTFIYLHAYQEGDPYDLLCDEAVKPMAKQPPTRDQMSKVAENQFSHLTFSQYIQLNQRSEIKLPLLLQIVRDFDSYEAFRGELLRAPIQHENDLELLAGLKASMDSIEAMRNCVAHNRRPSETVVQNYNNARPLVDQLLTDYLTQLEVEEPPPHAPGEQGNADEP